jgi:propanol-preferring alcohol dehydrogenase
VHANADYSQSAGYAQAIDYLRENGRLMAVGLPGKATLNASIFFTVFKSITIHGSYVGNRQDAIEAISIAATGAVKCHYQLKKLQDIEQYVFALIFSASWILMRHPGYTRTC